MIVEARRFTVEEYHRMADLGILNPDERVELIAGQIIAMAAKLPTHCAAVKRADRLLRSRLGEGVLLRLQSPIQLDNYSEPDPDIAVVTVDPLDYEDHHPTVGEVYLIIEVADTTLARDTGFKARVYAQSRIADYWVLALNNRQLHVFREPTANGYSSCVILSEDATISPLAFPDCSITVREMLRPL